MIEHSHNPKQGSDLNAALNSIIQVTNSALQSIRNNVLCKVLGSSRGQEKAMEKERNMGLGFRVPCHSSFGKSVKWVSKKPIRESISHSLDSSEDSQILEKNRKEKKTRHRVAKKERRKDEKAHILRHFHSAFDDVLPASCHYLHAQHLSAKPKTSKILGNKNKSHPKIK